MFREALQKSGADDPGKIIILRPQTKSFADGNLLQIFMSFGAGSIGWLTMKWEDEYICPLIKEKIDAPGKNLLDGIKNLVSNK